MHIARVSPLLALWLVGSLAAAPALLDRARTAEQAPAVSRQVTATATATTADVDVEAAVEAHGEGVMEFRGDVTLVMEGRGTLWVNEGPIVRWDEDSRVEMASQDGGYLYTVSSSTNEVRVTGRAVQVRFEGESLRVTAQGNGTAVFMGSGYFDEPDQSGRWTEEGVTIPIRTSAQVSAVTHTVTGSMGEAPINGDTSNQRSTPATPALQSHGGLELPSRRR